MGWLFKRKKDEAQILIDEAVKEDKIREKEEEKQRKIQEKQKVKEERRMQRIQSIQRIQEKPKMIDFSKQVIEAPFEEVRETKKLGKKKKEKKSDKIKLSRIKSEKIEPEPQETLHLSLNEIQDLKRCPKCKKYMRIYIKGIINLTFKYVCYNEDCMFYGISRIIEK